jgi:hypothetical protein
MTIKGLGRWESLEMVQRYTRSVTFADSLKFYNAPLGSGKQLSPEQWFSVGVRLQLSEYFETLVVEFPGSLVEPLRFPL